MVKWGFGGGPASHGTSLKHRQIGSIGNRRRSGKVWPGKKMAGKMGNKYQVTQNLVVFRIDYDRSLIYVKGGVSGTKGALIEIYDSIKKVPVQFGKLKYPTFIPEKNKVYPSLMEFTETVDLNEKFVHDNDEVLGVSDEEDESHGAKEPMDDDDEAAMKKAA